MYETNKPVYALRILDGSELTAGIISPTIHHGEFVMYGSYLAFAPYKKNSKILSKSAFNPDRYDYFDTLEEAYAKAKQDRIDFCKKLNDKVDKYFAEHPKYDR